jgi:hypothetical protein
MMKEWKDGEFCLLVSFKTTPLNYSTYFFVENERMTFGSQRGQYLWSICGGPINYLIVLIVRQPGS